MMTRRLYLALGDSITAGYGAVNHSATRLSAFAGIPFLYEPIV